MLITMQNSELIDKLVTIAGGSIDLVQDAVRAAALRGLVQRNEYAADLADVVDYIRAKNPAQKERLQMSDAGRQMLQTTVRRIEYDFVSFTGRLYMAEGCCCDMSQCIAFFKRIDSNVIFISTIAGKEGDTSYRLIDGEWHAFGPRIMRADA